MKTKLSRLASGLGLVTLAASAAAHDGHGHHDLVERLALALGLQHTLPVVAALYAGGFLAGVAALHMASLLLTGRAQRRAPLAWRFAAGTLGGLGALLLARA
ncbi:hypothetical protein BurJ1DRAFT_1618 [Burkholderiales bacterium JOSHI_001]|nr:hypothetical protein BurJ1DRAFT_1618 [Burkholderiales bacterium JOSHI_001]